MSNVPQDVIDDAVVSGLVGPEIMERPLRVEAIESGLPPHYLRQVNWESIEAFAQLRAKRSNAEPVAYVLMNEHGDMVMWSQDRSVSEYDQKAFWPKTKIVDLYSAPPDYDAGVAAGMMKAAEIARMTSQETSCRRAADRILSAIPADSKAALREVCIKVAKEVRAQAMSGPFELDELQPFVNSVLEDKS